MVYVIQVCWQLASTIRMELQFRPDPALLLCLQRKNSWWWTEELSETCRVLFQGQIWEISASSRFCYKNLSLCTVTWTSNNSTTLCLMSIYVSNYTLHFLKSKLPLMGSFTPPTDVCNKNSNIFACQVYLLPLQYLLSDWVKS